MKNKRIEDFRSCPYCGNDAEYYEKDHVRGVVNTYHLFNGKEADNGNTHDHLLYRPASKFYFCGSCHKRICKKDQ